MKSEKFLYILLNSEIIPYWQLKILNSFKDIIEMRIFIAKGAPPHTKKSLFLNLFQKLDNKIFKKKINSFENITLTSTTFSDCIVEIDYEKFIKNIPKALGSKSKIFLLNLTNIKLNPKFALLFEYGIWQFNIGTTINNIRNSNGIYEVINKIYSTESSLTVITGKEKKEMIISQNVSSTDPNSITRGINKVYLKASSYPMQIIKKLEMGYKLEDIFICYFKKEDSTITLKNSQIIYKILNHYLNYLMSRIINRFYLKQWFLLFQKKNNPMANDIICFNKIFPPKDRYYADPFIINYQKKLYIFIEEILFEENKGFISVIKFDEKGNAQKPIKVLEENYHMSYPFIIQESNKFFMIPETSSNKKISIYECINFPNKWEFKMHLMEDVVAADTTIFKKNNYYWMFANVSNDHDNILSDNLNLYFSDNLLSKNWKPHPLNPIISDARKARPAGNIFYYKDKIIRPSQNCLKNYGSGIIFNEIKILNDKEYHEQEIKSINTDWDPNIYGLHTINNLENFTVVDALRKIRK